MSEWPLVRLGVLVTKIGSGATPRGGASVYREEGISFIRSQNILDNSMLLDGVARITDEAADALRSVTVLAGDVLVNITGDSVARTSLVDPAVLPARVNQHVAVIRTNGRLDSRFLQKYLVSPRGKTALMTLATGGATRKALTKAHLESLAIPLPPLGEQRAIGEVLGALDDKIAANTKLAATARELALAMVPVAGDRAPVRELATLQKAQIDPGTLGDEAVDHYSLPAFDSRNGPEVVKATSIKSSKFVVSEPSVLISKLNPRFPRVWDLARLNGRRALASTEFLVLEPRGISTSVLWSLLAQPSFGRALESKVAGTSGSHQRVKPIEVLLAGVSDPRGWPDESRASIESLSSAALAADAENRTLAAIRDALLPQLMSGGLRVRDFERVADGT
ncbi:restriction endonuclease subunit S [Agromyces bauzanensis]|uniref:Type I restriction modification DNA specificity domain-containing protein n=1 Tax=Agromyces bauzanensis TaxID=1308924 RepID=A0A917UUU5_9MICO|nr:restriction endonuclease subunit S [Agromyces bauzanensis]GGJ86990.1 hypothetical protein GCM10011372_26770 [Agromyces bauzanensis]